MIRDYYWHYGRITVQTDDDVFLKSNTINPWHDPSMRRTPRDRITIIYASGRLFMRCDYA